MTAVLLSPLFEQFEDNNGAPLVGGKIFSYLAGTLTPQATYTDATGVTPAANPIILNAAGRPVGGVWGSGVYKFILKDSLDNTIDTLDNVTAVFGAGDMTKAVYDPANIAQQVVGTTAVQTITNKTFDTSNSFPSTIGRIVQQVRFKTGALATGTTLIPNDDTIPQITEGDEYMTLAITPSSATSILRVEVLINMSSSVLADIIAALFQDATASALAANLQSMSAAGASGFVNQLSISYDMVAGTTSSTTFRVRAGASSANTLTVNGFGGARKMGGVMYSSITITELRP